jgi:tight adherence protein C
MLLVLCGAASLLGASRRRRDAPLPARRGTPGAGVGAVGTVGAPRLPASLERWCERSSSRLALAGEGKTLRRFLADKLLAAAALPAIPLLPLGALAGRPPSFLFVAPLALAGFVVPDLSLRHALKRRRERILLDLPDALSMLALALAAGRSLHQALALAAGETGGPLGADIASALNRARREPSLGERGALVELARARGEPNFTRFAELLAAKESPYLEFLRNQAAQARAEQNRALEQAAERAYLAMHAPLAPLLTTLVLLVSYGFLHLLDHSV